MLPRACAVALAICLSCQSAFASCGVIPYRFIWGVDATVYMSVTSGEACTSALRISGTFRSINVVVPAKHGIGGAAGLYRWGYQSKRGYVGPDDFVVRVEGESPTAGVGSTKINVHVDVTR